MYHLKLDTNITEAFYWVGYFQCKISKRKCNEGGSEEEVVHQIIKLFTVQHGTKYDITIWDKNGCTWEKRAWKRMWQGS